MKRYKTLRLLIGGLVLAPGLWLSLDPDAPLSQVLSALGITMMGSFALLVGRLDVLIATLVNSLERWIVHAIMAILNHSFSSRWSLGGKIVAPPGRLLRRFAEFVFTKKTMREVFEPTLVDFEMEYLEALQDGNVWKIRWVRIRGYWSFWSAVVAQAPLSLLKRLFELWRAA